MKKILLFILINGLIYADCANDIQQFKAASNRASIHIEGGSSNFDILFEINLAKKYLVDAMLSCKTIASKKQQSKMKNDLKTLNSLIKQAKKW